MLDHRQGLWESGHLFIVDMCPGRIHISWCLALFGGPRLVESRLLPQLVREGPITTGGK